MKAVIYCRVSTTDQVKNLSLSTQRRACSEYCGREGLEVAEIFEDAGESAKTTDRPDFQRMLSYCETHRGHVGVLVVHTLSRFSRNVHDHQSVRAALMKLGIVVRSATETLSEDPVGLFMGNILAASAQFENDQKAQRTKAGMRAALQLGRWIWKAPVGYVTGQPRLGEPSLIPDAERAPLISKAFELMAVEGKSASEVLRTVTALGLTSRTRRALTAQTFGNLLRNPIYTGHLPKTTLSTAQSQGDFEPLVQQAVFDRVQARLSQAKGKRQHVLDRPEFPLRRFVICSACGCPLTGSSSRGRSGRYAYYHCRTCRRVRVQTHILESQFMELLSALKPQPQFAGLFRAVVLDVWRERRSEADRLLADLRRRLADLRQQESEIDDAYVFHRRVDSVTYERLRDRVRADIRSADARIAENQLGNFDVERVLDFGAHVISNAAAIWTEAESGDKRRLQDALFPERLQFDGVRIGTGVTCSAFSLLADFSGKKEGLASPPGIEPGSWP